MTVQDTGRNVVIIVKYFVEHAGEAWFDFLFAEKE